MMPSHNPTGRIESINVSQGGVPKRPVPRAAITREGVGGDRQNDLKHHGGPDRAVCIYSLEIIERLREEGHPIAAGTTGENLTISGLDWSLVVPGARLRIAGGVELEITSYTNPCATIRDSFQNLNFRRIKQDLHPGDSRVYARVLIPGEVETGAPVSVSAE